MATGGAAVLLDLHGQLHELVDMQSVSGRGVHQWRPPDELEFVAQYRSGVVLGFFVFFDGVPFVHGQDEAVAGFMIWPAR